MAALAITASSRLDVPPRLFTIRAILDPVWGGAYGEQVYIGTNLCPL